MRLHLTAAIVGLCGLSSTAVAGPMASVETVGADQVDAPAKDVDEADLRTEEVELSGIINGEDATAADYPMTGGLLIDTLIDLGGFGSAPVQSFMCSSTLIAPDVVLIAAHCIDAFALTFGFGDLIDTEHVWSRTADLSSYDGSSAGAPWPGDAVVVADTVMHPDWDMQGLGLGLALNYDIALLFLDEAVLDVQPALLPTPAEAASLAVDMEVAVVGWGQQEHVSGGWGAAPEPGTFMLKQQGMSHIAEINDYELKVGEVESDVRKCHGDSGGPSFAWVGEGTEETMRLVGVTSHAYDSTDCAETGGVDTRVDYYLEWIDEEMRARCTDGTRVWCDEPGILPVDYFEATSDDEEEDSGVDGSGDGSADDSDTVDGDGDGESKGGCSTAAGALSGVGLLVSMVAVARRRDD